jgi:hypothetical protein
MELGLACISSMSSQMAALSRREPKGRGMPSWVEIREIETLGTRIQSAMGVSGPPLLLLHGYPLNPPDPAQDRVLLTVSTS